jgi:hypothetical protein
VSTGIAPVGGRELLDDEAISLEELYLGLRTSDGLPSHRVPPPIRSRWEAEGWAESRAERVRLSAEGWLRLDALVATLASQEHPIPVLGSLCRVEGRL